MRSFVFWHSDDEEVKGQAWKGNANANEGVDGIAVKWNDHQEDGTAAEDNGEEKAELRAQKKQLEISSGLTAKITPPLWRSEHWAAFPFPSSQHTDTSKSRAKVSK